MATPTSPSCAMRDFPPNPSTSRRFRGKARPYEGNTPFRRRTNLTFDQANWPTSYGTTATYAYNGDGPRMSKTVSNSTSQFLWDASSTASLRLKDGLTAYVYRPGGLPLEQINGSTTLWLHIGPYYVS